MKRSANPDKYRSTGWAYMLGDARDARRSNTAIETRAARKAERSAAMDAIVDRICVPKFLLKERGQS